MVMMKPKPANMCIGCKYLSSNERFCLSGSSRSERNGICKFFDRKESNELEDTDEELE